MVVLARPSIALVSLMAKPRLLSRSMTDSARPQLIAWCSPMQRDGQVLELAVGRRQADAVVRAEHAAGFEAVAELDRSCR